MNRLLRYFNVGIFLAVGLCLPSTVRANTSIHKFSLSITNPYLDTKIDLNPGDVINIRKLYSDYISIPGSSISWIGTPGDSACVAPTNYPLPGVPCWSLIARVGSGPPFSAYTTILNGFFTFTATRSGHLYLGINGIYPLTGYGHWTIQVMNSFTPPPPPPTPFLELPWAYQQLGLSFNNAAGRINSFFDHQFPLISTGISEPVGTEKNVLAFNGVTGNEDIYYSGHDGYDYGKDAGASISAQVLAAAAGCATYHTNSAIGNAIYIDHPNYYQTRYYHMQPDGLATKSATLCKEVNQGDPIGLVGSTGRSTGAHIHFMVIEDKNHDGNYDDNIPDGITDPFGWQSFNPDPWPNFHFTYHNLEHTGNKSYYLWLHPIKDLSDKYDGNQKIFELEQYRIAMKAAATTQPANINLILGPWYKISDKVKSVTSSLQVSLTNLFNTPIHDLLEPFTLSIDYSGVDLSRYKSDTLTIFSSSDGNTWQPEETIIDQINKTASGHISHLSYFTLAAELLDTTPPVTTATVSAEPIVANSYAEPITFTLLVTDPGDSLGIDYTMYRVGDNDWQTYSSPFTFSDDGTYQLEFYSVDNEENIEEVNTYDFIIDSSLAINPEILINLNLKSMSLDYTASPSGDITTNYLANHQQDIIATKLAKTTTLNLSSWDWLIFHNFLFHTITYNTDSPFDLGDVYLQVSAIRSRQSQLKGLTEILTYNSNDYVILAYQDRVNKTSILIKKPYQRLSLQTFTGIKLLQLYTDQGSLNYTY